MQIVAALFTDEINLRQVAGPSTRIDLTGVQFSAVAPSPLPLTWAPHLVVIIRCGEGEPTNAAPDPRARATSRPQLPDAHFAVTAPQ